MVFAAIVLLTSTHFFCETTMKCSFLFILFMLLPLYALAQDSAKPSEAANTDNQQSVDNNVNGIVEYNEYSKTAEYSWCSDLPYNCKRVTIKYELKKRCLDDSNACEYFKKGDYSIWKNNESIVSGSTEFAIGRTQEGVDEFMKVEDALRDKDVKVKKRKYSIETKPMEIKAVLEDKTVDIDSHVRKMCPIKKDNKVSSACECYLMKDNCGNYIEKNGKIIYNTKYTDADEKTIKAKLEEDGCYLADHIGERIQCRKPKFNKAQ